MAISVKCWSTSFWTSPCTNGIFAGSFLQFPDEHLHFQSTWNNLKPAWKEGIDDVTTKMSSDLQSIQVTVIPSYTSISATFEAFGRANAPQLRRHRDRLFDAENGPEEGAPGSLVSASGNQIWQWEVMKSWEIPIVQGESQVSRPIDIYLLTCLERGAVSAGNSLCKIVWPMRVNTDQYLWYRFCGCITSAYTSYFAG